MSEQSPFSKLKLGFEFSSNKYDKEGVRLFVCSQSGAGKSHGSKVFVEELHKVGYPIVIIDPEGEYPSFSEKYPSVIVGGGFADLPLTESIIRDTIALTLTTTEPLITIFDLSKHLTTKRSEFASIIQKELFIQETDHRRALFFVIEECQLIAPQQLSGGMIESRDMAVDIAKRGRKRGINSIWISQRPASVAKDVISQCNVWMIGQLMEKNDLMAVKGILSNAGLKQTEVMQLDQQFYYFNGIETNLIKFRKTSIRDLGKTPQLKDQFKMRKKSNKSISATLQELLKKIDVEQKEEKQKVDEVERLRKQNSKLLAENEQLEKDIIQLDRDMALVSNIRVSSGGSGDVSSAELDKVLNDKRSLEKNLSQVKQRLKETQDQYQIISDKYSTMNQFEQIQEQILSHAQGIQTLLQTIESSPQAQETIILEEFGDQEIVLNHSTGIEQRIAFVKHPTVKKMIFACMEKVSKPIVELIIKLLTQKEYVTYKDVQIAGLYKDKSNISRTANHLIEQKILKKGKGENNATTITLNLEGLSDIISNYEIKKSGEKALEGYFSEAT